MKETRDFSPEFSFKSSRSSGAGGQHVNKVNTKVELRLDVRNSQLLTEDEKQLVLTRLENRITQDGILIIVSQADRSQLRNKENTIALFYTLLAKALHQQKKRLRKKRSRASIEKRLESKRKNSIKKKLRNKNID